VTEIAMLSDVALSLQDGPFGSNLKSSHYVDQGVRVVRLQNIGVGYFDDRDRAFVPDAHFARLKKHECRAGDVLIATLGDPIIRACLQPSWLELALNKADCLRLRCDPNRSVPEYVVHFLNSGVTRAQAENLAHGQTRPRVNLSQVRSLKIPLPPLAEQRRIARVLDAVDSVRQLRRRTLDLLASLRAAMFAMCSRESCRTMSLGDLLDRIDSGKSPVCASHPATDGQWGVLKLGAVSFGEYRPWENKAMLATGDVDPRLEVADGDVLLARKNTLALVGASAYVWETPQRLLLPDLIFRLVPRASAPITAVFLQAALAQPRTRAAISRLAGGSAGSMPNVSKKRLLTVEVDVPRIEVQLEYRRRIAAVESLRKELLQHLSQLDLLFASVQSRAFTESL
jgi:type I restriction enzyme S subunit